MDLQLQRANAAQCQSLMAYFGSLSELTQWGGEGFQFPIIPQQFLSQLALVDTMAFALTRQQQLVGFGQLCQRFGRHHLARLFIIPELRGQGLAYSLINGLLYRAMQLDPAKGFSLYVYRHNRLAVQCYQKIGFIISPQPTDYRADLHFMTLDHQKAQQRLNSVLHVSPSQLITTAGTLYVNLD